MRNPPETPKAYGRIRRFQAAFKRGSVIYPFALNIDTPDNDTAAKRVPLAKECLRLLGAF